MASERGPLESARALMWTLLLGVVLLAVVVRILSEIWLWLLGIAVVVALIGCLVLWRRRHRDRW